jgi:hypothetical protein
MKIAPKKDAKSIKIALRTLEAAKLWILEPGCTQHMIMNENRNALSN